MKTTTAECDHSLVQPHGASQTRATCSLCAQPLTRTEPRGKWQVEKPMTVGLRAAKVFKAMSRETTCFKARLLVNGVDCGTVENDGGGGPNMYEITRGNGGLWKLLSDTAKAATRYEYCALDGFVERLLNMTTLARRIAKWGDCMVVVSVKGCEVGIREEITGGVQKAGEFTVESSWFKEPTAALTEEWATLLNFHLSDAGIAEIAESQKAQAAHTEKVEKGNTNTPAKARVAELTGYGYHDDWKRGLSASQAKRLAAALHDLHGCDAAEWDEAFDLVVGHVETLARNKTDLYCPCCLLRIGLRPWNGQTVIIDHSNADGTECAGSRTPVRTA